MQTLQKTENMSILTGVLVLYLDLKYFKDLS